jgi:hypothetical protein
MFFLNLSAILSAPFYLNYIGDPYASNDACDNAGYFGEGDWCRYKTNKQRL